MMKKIKFKKACRDKYTEEVYTQFQVKEFEDDRADEIIKKGYADEVIDVAMPEAPEKPENDNMEGDEITNLVNLDDLTVNELRKIAKESGVSTKGKKQEIIERLMTLEEK